MVILPPRGFSRWREGPAAMDGASARWVIRSRRFMPKMLDPGDWTRTPLLIANGPETTVCRVAMATRRMGRLRRRGEARWRGVIRR